MNTSKWLPQAILSASYFIIALLFMSSLYMWMALYGGFQNASWSEMRHYFHGAMYFVPFYVPPSSHPYGLVVVSFILCWFTWLFSTRVRMSNSSLFKRKLCFIAAWGTFSLIFGVFAVGYMKPISFDAFVKVDSWVTKKEFRPYLHPGSLKLLGHVFMMIPVFLIFNFWSKALFEYRTDSLVSEWFETYKFKMKWLGRFGDMSSMSSPDLLLAKDAEYKTDIIVTSDSRQLGILLLGPPGSGKTSLKIIVAFKQDLAHFQNMVNAFPNYVHKYGLDTEAFRKAMGQHLIGSIIIEPAQDLCDTAYQLAIDHGIPEELIVYLDPTNPNTPGFNSMIGPIEQVAETITTVLDGMSEVSDEFFKQSCRTVLKMYIYLLKFLRKNDCTLLDLDHMYQDPRYVADLVEELQAKIPEQDSLWGMPRDQQIYWMLDDRTVRWFGSDGLEEVRDRDRQLMKFTQGPHKGKIQMKDKQFEFTRTTRNLLSDLITNPYLARILIGDNQVDLDKLMEVGGFLLCNTALGELGSVSDAFGKLVLLSAQSATFRRKGTEEERALISVYVDEFFDYMYMMFLKWSSQARKYRLAILVATQTLAQFDIKFGRGFTDGMLGTIRNAVVYGGVGKLDAEVMSPLFGMTMADEMKFSESFVPETSVNANYSYSEGTTRKEIELVSEDKIMFNKFKFSYIRLVVDKSTEKGVRAEGAFVDRDRTDKWKKRVKPQSMEAFLRYWRQPISSSAAFNLDWIDTIQVTADMKEADRFAEVAAKSTLAVKIREELELNNGEQEISYIGKRFVDIPKEETRSRYIEIESIPVKPAPTIEYISAKPAPAEPMSEDMIAELAAKEKARLVDDARRKILGGSVSPSVEKIPPRNSPVSPPRGNPSPMDSKREYGSPTGKKDGAAPRASDLLFKGGFDSPGGEAGNDSRGGNPSPEEILIQHLRETSSTHREINVANPAGENVSPEKAQQFDVRESSQVQSFDEAAPSLEENLLPAEAGAGSSQVTLESNHAEQVPVSRVLEEAGPGIDSKMERVVDIQKTDPTISADVNLRRQKERSGTAPRLHSLKKADEVDIKTNPVLAKIFAKKNDGSKRK